MCLGAAVLICLAILAGTAAAQASRNRKPKTPRAVALVEWPAKGAPRVVPIAILVDGRYYDAGIYMADPVPLALDPGTVYQVEESGEPAGFATITEALQPQGGNWFAQVRFAPKQTPASASARAAAPPVRPEPEEGPPKLRKQASGQPGEKEPPQPPSTGTPPTLPPSPGEGPPVLRKPADTTTAPQTTPPTLPPPPGEGPPVLRKPAEDASSAPTQQKTAEPEPAPAEDSARPRLRRGGTGREQAEELPGSVVVPRGARGTTSSSSAPKGASVAQTPPVRVLPAISDAGGPEPKPYKFDWSADEQKRLTAAMTALGQAALEKYASSYAGGKPGKLENVEVRAFDLTYNNEPNLVLTAAAHPTAAAPARRARTAGQAAESTAADASLTYWITVVAREDLNGDLRQLQAWATDSKHLDVFPRRELIDAVDADGDGRGELLFRLVGDRGRDFAIDRVTPDQIREVYNSGELR